MAKRHTLKLARNPTIAKDIKIPDTIRITPNAIKAAAILAGSYEMLAIESGTGKTGIRDFAISDYTYSGKKLPDVSQEMLASYFKKLKASDKRKLVEINRVLNKLTPAQRKELMQRGPKKRRHESIKRATKQTQYEDAIEAILDFILTYPER